MQSRFLWTAAAVALCGLLAVGGCLPSDEEAVPLTGLDAYTLARKERAQAPSTDVKAVQSLIRQGIEDEEGVGGDEDRYVPREPVGNMMRKGTKAKVRLDTGKFELLGASYFLQSAADEETKRRHKDDDVDLSTLDDEFTIQGLDQIPVRNQGQRGTCASFAGLGHLEYVTVRKFGLSTLDLSEQRFYYMSKPECQSSGCQVDVEGGSWYGTGFDESRAAADPPGDNIPLEADCPYNPNPGSNELQVPQLGSCSRGAIKVTSTSSVIYPSEVIDALHKHQPVLWASPLSDNWFDNRGLITEAAARASEENMHAGGHAYLIVGYRKIDDASEGGMCFIVKNSWGTGWGVNGYSCQTLAWMRKWRFYEGSSPVWLEHPVVEDVTLRSDLQDGELPDNDDAEDESPPDIPDEELDDDTEDDDEVDPAPLPDPEPGPAVDWTDFPLYGPNDSYYKAQIAKGSEGAFVRLELRGDVSHSGSLALEYDDSLSGTDSDGCPQGDRYLVYDGDIVGEIRPVRDASTWQCTGGDQDLLLCSDKYALICSLRLDPNTNSLYIEFPYPGLRSVASDEMSGGLWSLLLPEGILGDHQLQWYQPEDETELLTSDKTYLRLNQANPDGSRENTDPLRVTHDSEGGVNVMGVGVGNLLDVSLCTDDYEDSCRFISNDKRLLVLPGW